MSICDKALWVIERNSGQDLTLSAVAEACGVSRSHLAFVRLRRGDTCAICAAGG